jgi:hypothetical protein
MNLQTSQPVRNFAAESDAASTLLRHLIDYAGLFPPASLAMAASAENYNVYSQAEWNWILGRFIVPVARLGEFEKAFAAIPTPTQEKGIANWQLSVLLGSDPSADMATIREFNARMMKSAAGRRAMIEAVELKAASAKEVAQLSAIIPEELETYFEIALSGPADCIAAVAASGRKAKLRTGGETADKFPSAGSVAEFLRLCAASNLPFKATAGLHHPLRSIHRFTYQPDSPLGMMHGFLNVFLAAAFLRSGLETKLAAQLLEEKSPQAFNFDLDGVGWREHRLSQREIAAARQNFAISFGSCSFTEPIDDLRSLHLL